MGLPMIQGVTISWSCDLNMAAILPYSGKKQQHNIYISSLLALVDTFESKHIRDDAHSDKPLIYLVFTSSL